MEKIADFCYELGQLKRLPRSGWLQLGVANPESVAEHVARTVPIAFILAKLEGVNAERAALIAAFHEFPETRIGDLHKTAQRYITEKRTIEAKAVEEQLSQLPPEIAAAFLSYYDGFEEDGSPEHIVAKDADYLECIIQAKEHLEQGYAGAQNWIENARACLQTKSAKALAAAVVERRSTAWFEALKRIQR